MIGICRQFFNRLRDRLDAKGLSGTIIAPLVGGLIVGTIGWALPLTIGDGNMSVAPTISLTFQQVEQYKVGVDDLSGEQIGHMTAHLLLCCAFAKMCTLAVSLNCGLVGGLVFPLITIGVFSGCTASLYYPYLPVGFCVSCFMAAVPGGICPMPFTLIGIAIYSFFFGSYQTIPIYIATITSYTVVCGSGIFKALADRGEAAQAERKKMLQEREKGADSEVSNPIRKEELSESSFSQSVYRKTNRPVAPRADEFVTEV